MAHIDLTNDLKVFLESELVSFGFNPDASHNLDDVLLRYLNVQGKRPKAIKWKVKFSKEIYEKAASGDLKKGVERLASSARKAESLWPYLSTRITDPDHQDLLLHDWRILHFHLGLTLDPNGFVARTRDVAFGVTDQTSSTLYLIDILSHKFSHQDLLAIVNTNWPKLLETSKAGKDVLGLSHNASNEEIHKLRKAGINTLIQLPNGEVVVPPGLGITMAGGSVAHRLTANNIKRTLKRCQAAVLAERQKLESICQNLGFKWNTLQFHLVPSSDPNFRVVEMRTGLEVFDVSLPL